MLRACRHLLSCQFEHNELRGRSRADDRGALTLRSEVGAELGLRARTRGGGADSGLRAPRSLPGMESWLLAPLTLPLPSAQGPGGLPFPASFFYRAQPFRLPWPFASRPLVFSLSSRGLVQFAGRVHWALPEVSAVLP